MTGDEAVTSDGAGRRRFHLALAGAFTLVASPLISWWVALQQPKADGGPWRSRLLRLALFDTAIFLFFGVALVRAPDQLARAKDTRRPRIGIVMKQPAPPDGVEIASLVTGSPADGAGLRVGDLITAVDGQPLRTNEQLTQLVTETALGASRTFHVRRGGEEFDASIAPVAGLPTSPGSQPRLFEPMPRPAKSLASLLGKSVAIFLPALLLLTGLAVAARRRGAGVGPAAWVMVSLIGSVLCGFVTLVAFGSLAGFSLGGVMVSQLLASLAVFAFAGVWLRRHAHSASALEPGFVPMASPTAFLFGLFYAFAGMIRLAMLQMGASALFRLPTGRSTTEVFGVSPSWGLVGFALFGVASVVVAPIAEELLFRGVLLPWLASWMKPPAALAWSALLFGVVHLQYGPGALVIVIIGVALGWARLATGKLHASIALHMAWNFMVLVAIGRTLL
jgi:uncharacterized protein